MEWMRMIGPLVPLIFEPLKAVTKHMTYPFQVSNNISSLELATRELRAVKEDVQITIRNAERENGAPTEQVKLWLDEVEAVEQNSETIQQKYRQLRKCLGNIYPNLWSNYKISRSAAHKQVEVNRLRNNKASIELIVQMPLPLAQEMPASTLKSPNLEQAVQDIKDDVHNIIGIWGMGGVGKTHLLEQINNELVELFGEDTCYVVVFVTCSKECSEEKVQEKIIEKLGLKMNNDVGQRQRSIFNFLKKRNFVLLLDDLWNHVDLKTIGIPNPLSIEGSYRRKVVLTTRSTEVCAQMEVQKRIRVHVLNENDAWSLFKEKVTEETINSDPQIQKCAINVAKELGGLPLALITVGRAMHDKMDPSEWEHAIELLKQARLHDVEFSTTDKSVFHILKFSYDNLRNNVTLQQCFLHCSLWPEDYHIHKGDLVQLWMGLGLINEPSIHTSYNVGYSYIRRLQSVCLLEAINNDYRIKMHDVIRDMALWIVHNEWIVQAGTYKEHQVIEISHTTEKLSLMYNKTMKVTFSIPYSSTKLSAVLLRGNKMNNLESLKLNSFGKLTILDLSRNSLESFPIEICKLVHLIYLDLSWNYKIMSLPKELGTLIELKYLFLDGMKCTISEGVLSKLKALQVLISRYIYCVGGIESSGTFTSLVKEIESLGDFKALGIAISNTQNFQELCQTSVPIRWLEVDIFQDEDCLSFTSCFLTNFQLQSNLTRVCINGRVLKWVKFERTNDSHRNCHHEKLETLYFNSMENMKGVIWKGLNPNDVFPRLQILKFTMCHHLKSISWVVCLPSIREIHVWSCGHVRQLIRIDELKSTGLEVKHPPFQFLKKLILSGNVLLECISDPVVTFPALELLVVFQCDMLKKLPFNTGNPPTKLKVISGPEQWWNTIEMEDNSHRSSLQPFFRKWCKTTLA